MFLGHFGVALAAKKAAPAVSLGMLFLAAQLADLIWPLLLLAGIEVVAIEPGITAVTPLDFISYPWSHSAAMLAACGIVLAIAYRFALGGRIADAVVLALLVVSHWVLDFASHRPDMPLTPYGTEKLGLGLWDSIPATLLVEFALLAAGTLVYLRITRAVNRAGSLALWALIAFLAVVYLASVFGPPPPSAITVAWSALAMWLLVAWGFWVDRNRVPAGNTGVGDR
jgi:hypothetical protein